ncbi:MAG: alpha/beta hydrolase [Chloroflexi bacterium]|nr:MAG: alpha/beta hydrolase [Chloroflexota bacterium]
MMHVAVRDPRIVLVPGGFTGAWMWADVAALLEAGGIEAVTVELPTIEEQSAGADFYADARAVRELLDRLEPPVLLCGHSYGGAVITEAASGPHPAVRELVYLTAAVPGTGDSMVSLMSAAAAQDTGAEEEGVTFREDGLAFLDREAARRALFNDCEPERAEDGLRRLRPMSLSGADQPVSAAAWTQLPSVYVRGSEDPMPEAVAPGFLERTSEIVELPTGHCPNWSRPDLVARLLADRARSIASERG